MNKDLAATAYIDSDNERIIAFARSTVTGITDKKRQAIELYYAVRDGFPYNPYRLSFDKNQYKASFVIEAGEGFCIQKAILLAAAARAIGIPARLGFGNVRNHLATKKLLELMKTDLFVFHGYTVLNIDGIWVKATPAFDKKLCDKFRIHPLEFDGTSDSVFQPYDLGGARHMEYVHDYGIFADFPYEMMIEELKIHYPHLIEYYQLKDKAPLTGDFRTEEMA
jgi:transglutaminase-like putative cysteine protease